MEAVRVEYYYGLKLRGDLIWTLARGIVLPWILRCDTQSTTHGGLCSCNLPQKRNENKPADHHGNQK